MIYLLRWKCDNECGGMDKFDKCLANKEEAIKFFEDAVKTINRPHNEFATIELLSHPEPKNLEELVNLVNSVDCWELTNRKNKAKWNREKFSSNGREQKGE